MNAPYLLQIVLSALLSYAQDLSHTVCLSQANVRLLFCTGNEVRRVVLCVAAHSCVIGIIKLGMQEISMQEIVCRK